MKMNNKFKQRTICLTLLTSFFLTACHSGSTATGQSPTKTNKSLIATTGSINNHAPQARELEQIISVSNFIGGIFETFGATKLKFITSLIGGGSDLFKVFSSDPKEELLFSQIGQIQNSLDDMQVQLSNLNSGIGQILDLNNAQINLLGSFTTRIFTEQFKSKVLEVDKDLFTITNKFNTFYNENKVGEKVFPMDEIEFYNYAKNLCQTDPDCKDHRNLIQALGGQYKLRLNRNEITEMVETLEKRLNNPSGWDDINSSYQELLKIENGNNLLNEDLALRVIGANNVVISLDATVFKAIQKAYYLSVLQLAFVHTHLELFKNNDALMISFPYAVNFQKNKPENFANDLLNARKYFFGQLYNQYVAIFGGVKAKMVGSNYQIDPVTGSIIFEDKYSEPNPAYGIKTRSATEYIQGLFPSQTPNIFDKSFQENCSISQAILPKEMNKPLFQSGSLTAQCRNGNQIHIPFVYSLEKDNTGSGVKYLSPAFSQIAYANNAIDIQAINQDILSSYQFTDWVDSKIDLGHPWHLNSPSYHQIVTHKYGTMTSPPITSENVNFSLGGGEIKLNSELKLLGAAKQLTSNLNPNNSGKKVKTEERSKPSFALNTNSINYPVSTVFWETFHKWFDRDSADGTVQHISPITKWGINDCSYFKACPTTVNHIGSNDTYLATTPLGNTFAVRYQLTPFNKSSYDFNSLNGLSFDGKYYQSLSLQCPTGQFPNNASCSMNESQTELTFISNDGIHKETILSSRIDPNKNNFNLNYAHYALGLAWSYRPDNQENQSLGSNAEISIPADYVNSTGAHHLDFTLNADSLPSNLIITSDSPKIISTPEEWGVGKFSSKILGDGNAKITFKNGDTNKILSTVSVKVLPQGYFVKWAYRPHNQEDKNIPIQKETYINIPIDYVNNTGVPHLDFIVDKRLEVVSITPWIFGQMTNWEPGKYSTGRIETNGHGHVQIREKATGKVLGSIYIGVAPRSSSL